MDDQTAKQIDKIGFSPDIHHGISLKNIKIIEEMKQSPFVLEDNEAQTFINNVNIYVEFMTQKLNYPLSHPVVASYKEILTIIHDKNDDIDLPSFLAYKVARYSTVVPHLKAIHSYYRNNDMYKFQLDTAHKFIAVDPQVVSLDAQNTFNMLSKVGVYLIGAAIQDKSSFICPKSYNSDPSALIESLINLNNNAKKEDIPVFIAGVYALCVQKQEVLRILAGKKIN
jgi:hypothetical protein